ncbi:hypothetical protein M406DRAFT_250987 [Cryphonectria parasitica EP155]|uniref:tRNA(Phe) 7-[(3-amino-3-carboxypropyl)-4-demethylwyosine(37)-N(4)]-methyltransferase n=1 Tax=Cryphonectria parasitica (strain ATCC 38755 / EP155) TaxID=660469 RepID=A0A9P5CSX1_CRYP1|nr:uncharacterized protein M406DRAFT_250987 [Cryphonectria parasitica EP155]KAF3768801.1 hypothetical protein M406DRAFT_250987 [Cryphonectria parasitica EP155]
MNPNHSLSSHQPTPPSSEKIHRPPQAHSQSHVPAVPTAFTRRKTAILAQLALPDEEYADLSPKGTVDAGIRDLIGEINGAEGLVTTSSCAGRVSVFLEGSRRKHGEGEVRVSSTVAGVGGKGGGGRWLFVSHEPVELHGKLDSEPNIVGALLGMDDPIFDGREGAPAQEMSGGESRLIHFKFEPMILHVLTASPYHAQLILRCGLQAGFRESGAINLIPPFSSSNSSSLATPPPPPPATPIVAIRSMGLGLESLIGRETNGIKHCTVSGDYLKALIKIANERFGENTRRIERFRGLLRAAVGGGGGGTGIGRVRMGDGGGAWENAEIRRERKRLEGLKRAEEVRRARLARQEGGTRDELAGFE